MNAMAAVVRAPALRQKVQGADRLAHFGLLLVAVLLCVGLLAPLVVILSKALDAPEGSTTSGVGNFLAYLASPGLLTSLWHSVWVSVLVTVIVVPLAFTFAYALTRSCMPAKPVLRAIMLLPLLAPSLLSAISLIYWFGNQGLARDFWKALGFDGIYGAPGIVLAECFASFPHVLMILVTALATADARLYEAADALGTSTVRKFFTITLPGARYGLISAAMVCFTLVITDFGIPKVVGGNFNVLATDVFKLVIGQQDFQRGAVVALLLLLPAVLTFGVDTLVQRKQAATLTARAVALVPRPARGFDAAMTAYCLLIAALVLAMFGMAVFASFAKLWPYNLAPGLGHYVAGLVDAELGDAMVNSLKLAASTAVIGTVVVFVGAWLLEKTRGMDALRPVVRLLAMLPMAVPGLVLGLGYIFFFNAPANPLNGLYQTLPLMVLCTVVHFYTTGHLTMVTALKAIDGEFEAVSASLKVPLYQTFWRVTLPICLPVLIDVGRYFFVNAMTTISAVVFLYSPDTKLASVAILNLDEAGDTGPAAAMAVLIAATSAVVTVLFMGLGRLVDSRTQRWRAPAR
ncbi:putative 2-aminoethylphosphonate ABC transporter permease subunit [Xylophilus sp. GOD-11R]|uniref:putative 2-aminoethylphosphonate ABC transporter permease subunit n=1 Tax=Xylophilus sp. GOD-11R TaxID=3089814 RepID=UPI00298D5252|nr:putative 2-aminoethylphosphonate ABC transporter permease subunit [Xylophilus sp. GOD-11R]WPB59021.1 putative 2-aminoethylphosphonate ABC transporter permease subunit [Xylophilus sp. GOD-11R]